VEVHYPLASDELLRQSLQTVGFNTVRMSKLYEFIDAITADVAYRHTDGLDESRPLSLVTAGHYDAKRLRPIDITKDLSIRSYVVLTGKSSLEIRTDTFQVDEVGSEQLVDVCHTVMVALDKTTNRPVQIRSLADGEEEQAARTEVVKQLRAKRAEQQQQIPSFQGKAPAPPKQDEMQSMHALIKEARDSAGADVEMMGDWTFTNSLMIYPERRNMHGKLFGGFVASTAYDLAYFCARAFCGGNLPFALGFDQMRFFAPVSIGDQLNFTARVVYTEGKIMRVWVDVEQLDPNLILGKGLGPSPGTLTNQMEFIFAHPSNDVTKIVPGSYTEVIRYLGAQRWQENTGPTEQHIVNYRSFIRSK